MKRTRILLPTAVAALLCLVPPRVAGGAAIIVTNTIQIARGEKWRPRFWFGNADDPSPPGDYRPEDQHRLAKWRWRNPCHNFNFYVIGIADKTFKRSGRFPDQVFNPRPGWNWAVCKYKWWRLPFAAYHHGRFRFYFGWRERGNFGIKLTLRD